MDQFTKFKAPIDSFELRNAMMGILKPGRYAGYDKMTSTDGETGLAVRISHDGTRGIAITDKSNNPTYRRGMFISQTGQIYREEGNHVIDLTLNSNVTSNVRYDFLIATVLYSENTAGNNITYSIEQNISLAIIEDGLWISNNANSVVLGVFKFAGSTGTIAGVEYTPSNDTILIGGDQSRFIIQESINKWVGDYITENAGSELKVIGDADIDAGRYNVTLEDIGKTIMVKGYTGTATQIECYMGGVGSQADNNEFHFIQDQLPIIITKAVTSTTEIRKPSDKTPKTRTQYSKISVFKFKDDIDNKTIYLVSGDMSS